MNVKNRVSLAAAGLVVLVLAWGAYKALGEVDRATVRTAPPDVRDSAGELETGFAAELHGRGDPSSDAVESVLLQATGGSRATLLAVTDSRGRVVPDASVHVANAEGVFGRRGITDEEGELLLQLSPSDHRLVVRTSAHAMHQSALPSPAPARIQVQLKPSGEIRGLVTRDGQPEAHAVVVAWPSHALERRLTSHVAHQAAQGAPDVLSATSDAGGSFMIDGLALDRQYNVLAAASGAVCHNMLRDVRPPQHGAVLELATVFGAQLDFGVADGTCNRTLAELEESDALEVLDGNALRLPLDLAPLMGHVGEGLSTYSASHPTFLFRSKNGAARSVGPVRLTVRRAGFAVKTVEFQCEPIGAAIPVVDARLEPLGSCLGTLEIEPVVPSGVPLSALFGDIRLVGERGAFRVALRDAGGLRRVCLPCGVYSVALDNALDGQPLHIDHVNVAAEQPSTIRLPTLGAIRIRVQRDDSETFRGHLSIDLALDRGGANAERAHRHLDLWAPTVRDEYWIVGLTPGHYALLVNGPFLPLPPAAHDSRGWISPLLVSEGSASELELQLAE